MDDPLALGRVAVRARVRPFLPQIFSAEVNQRRAIGVDETREAVLVQPNKSDTARRIEAGMTIATYTPDFESPECFDQPSVLIIENERRASHSSTTACACLESSTHAPRRSAPPVPTPLNNKNDRGASAGRGASVIAEGSAERLGINRGAFQEAVGASTTKKKAIVVRRGLANPLLESEARLAASVTRSEVGVKSGYQSNDQREAGSRGTQMGAGSPHTSPSSSLQFGGIGSCHSEGYSLQARIVEASASSAAKAFVFDSVHGEESTHEDIYCDTDIPAVLDAVLGNDFLNINPSTCAAEERPTTLRFNGATNASFISYGPSGSGKTHTMLGGGRRSAQHRSPDDRESGGAAFVESSSGLLPRVLDQLLKCKAAQTTPLNEESDRPTKTTRRPRVERISLVALELYLDLFYDLLVPKGRRTAVDVHDIFGAEAGAMLDELTKGTNDGEIDEEVEDDNPFPSRRSHSRGVTPSSCSSPAPVRTFNSGVDDGISTSLSPSRPGTTQPRPFALTPSRRARPKPQRHTITNPLRPQRLPIRGPEDIQKSLSLIFSNRTTTSTVRNNQSSRSHAIFIVRIDMTDADEREAAKGKGDKGASLRSRFITFVDLAGSERLDTVDLSLVGSQEALSINSSLAALTHVVREKLRIQQRQQQEDSQRSFRTGQLGFVAITDNNNSIPKGATPKARSVRLSTSGLLVCDNPPYRNTKLTQMLRPCFEASGVLYFFVHVMPGADTVDESIATLRFGEEVRRVVLLPTCSQGIDVTSPRHRASVHLSQQQRYPPSKKHSPLASPAATVTNQVALGREVNLRSPTVSEEETPSSVLQHLAGKESLFAISDDLRRLSTQHAVLCSELRVANAAVGYVPRRLQHLVRRRMLGIIARAKRSKTDSTILAAKRENSKPAAAADDDDGSGLLHPDTADRLNTRAYNVPHVNAKMRGAPTASEGQQPYRTTNSSSSKSLLTAGFTDYAFSLARAGTKREGVAAAADWILDATTTRGYCMDVRLTRAQNGGGRPTGGAVSFGFAAPDRFRRTTKDTAKPNNATCSSVRAASEKDGSGEVKVREKNEEATTISSCIPCSQFLWKLAEDDLTRTHHEELLVERLTEALEPIQRMVSIAESAAAEAGLESDALLKSYHHLLARLKGKDPLRKAGAKKESEKGQPPLTVATIAAGSNDNNYSVWSDDDDHELLAFKALSDLQHRLRSIKKVEKRLDALGSQLKEDVSNTFTAQNEAILSQVKALKAECDRIAAINNIISAMRPLATDMLLAGGKWAEAVLARSKEAARQRAGTSEDETERAVRCRNDAVWYSKLLVGIKKLPFAEPSFNVLLVPLYAFGDGRAKELYVPEALHRCSPLASSSLSAGMIRRHPQRKGLSNLVDENAAASYALGARNDERNNDSRAQEGHFDGGSSSGGARFLKSDADPLNRAVASTEEGVTGTSSPPTYYSPGNETQKEKDSLLPSVGSSTEEILLHTYHRDGETGMKSISNNDSQKATSSFRRAPPPNKDSITFHGEALDVKAVRRSTAASSPTTREDATNTELPVHSPNAVNAGEGHSTHEGELPSSDRSPQPTSSSNPAARALFKTPPRNRPTPAATKELPTSRLSINAAEDIGTSPDPAGKIRVSASPSRAPPPASPLPVPRVSPSSSASSEILWKKRGLTPPPTSRPPPRAHP